MLPLYYLRQLSLYYQLLNKGHYWEPKDRFWDPTKVGNQVTESGVCLDNISKTLTWFKRTSPQESKNLSYHVLIFFIIILLKDVLFFSSNSWHRWYFKRSASQESSQSMIATSTGSNCMNSWQCSFRNLWLSLPPTSWTWSPCRWKAQPYPSHPSNCTDLFLHRIEIHLFLRWK